MGGTDWNEEEYNMRASMRAASGEATFKHTAAIESGTAEKAAHESLDPKKMKNRCREARDSEAHPDSVPIAIGLDVTGSMRTVPALIQGKLKTLMGLLIRKSYVEHPQILIGGIGDAAHDDVPMQIGQFESGIEIENDLTNLYLEGGGGGNRFESYELFLYFLARMTKCDHYEKRGQKGFAFIIGDESLKTEVEGREVNEVFGSGTLQGNVSTHDILQEALEKWHIFYIIPKMTSHYDEDAMFTGWKKELGQNVLKLSEPEHVCEFLAALIAANTGVDMAEIASDVKEMSSDGAANVVTRDLTAYTPAGGAIAKTPQGASGLATL
jgi:hypothetical protein